MVVRDVAHVASGAQSGDDLAPLVTTIPRSYTQHREPRKLRENPFTQCPPFYFPCLCSVATNDSGVPKYLSFIASSGCPSTAIPDKETKSTPAASVTPPLSSSLNAQSTYAGPRPASLPSQTITRGTPSMDNAAPSASRDPLTSSASASGNVNASGSSSFNFCPFSAVASGLTGAIADYSHSLPPSPLPGGPSNASPTPSDSHRLNTRTVVGIVLGALSLFLVIALALFLLFRRRFRQRAKRMSTESSWRRLKPHPFDGACQTSLHERYSANATSHLPLPAFRWLEWLPQLRVDGVRLRVRRSGLRTPARPQAALAWLTVGGEGEGSRSRTLWIRSVHLGLPTSSRCTTSHEESLFHPSTARGSNPSSSTECYDPFFLCSRNVVRGAPGARWYGIPSRRKYFYPPRRRAREGRVRDEPYDDDLRQHSEHGGAMTRERRVRVSLVRFDGGEPLSCHYSSLLLQHISRR